MAMGSVLPGATASLFNTMDELQISNETSYPVLKQILSIPSEEEVASRTSIFSELAQALLGEQAVSCRIGEGPEAYISPSGENTLALVQIGLHGMGLWSVSDTMECLCIGTMSDDEFLDRLSKDPDASSLSPQIVRNAEESEDEVRLIISLRRVSIDIRYCQTPAVEKYV
jgi:hypothetical protein